MPRTVRTPLLVAAAGLAGLALVWLLAYAPTPARRLDGWGFEASQMFAYHHGLNAVGRLLAVPMLLPLYALLAAGAVLVARQTHGVRAAVGVGVLLAGTNAVAQLLKAGTATDRPWSLTGWDTVVGFASWPSGHAVASMVLVVGWTLAVAPHARRRVALIGGAWAALVGLSVVWMGWHMPSDTLGGWCLVAAAAGLAVAVARSTAASRQRPLRAAAQSPV